MKRSKTPDYRDKMVFGVPPIINVQRTGQPLPQSIQQAMRYIRSQCLDQVRPSSPHLPLLGFPFPMEWSGKSVLATTDPASS